MFSLLEALRETCFRKPEVNICVLGLDGAGKTTILCCVPAVRRGGHDRRHELLRGSDAGSSVSLAPSELEEAARDEDEAEFSVTDEEALLAQQALQQLLASMPQLARFVATSQDRRTAAARPPSWRWSVSSLTGRLYQIIWPPRRRCCASMAMPRE